MNIEAPRLDNQGPLERTKHDIDAGIATLRRAIQGEKELRAAAGNENTTQERRGSLANMAASYTQAIPAALERGDEKLAAHLFYGLVTNIHHVITEVRRGEVPLQISAILASHDTVRQFINDYRERIGAIAGVLDQALPHMAGTVGEQVRAQHQSMMHVHNIGTRQLTHQVPGTNTPQ